MPLFERQSASFIVRVWCEPDRLADSNAPLEWRGSIEHIDSGRRVYFRDLHAIEDFVRICIETPFADGDVPP